MAAAFEYDKTRRKRRAFFYYSTASEASALNCVPASVWQTRGCFVAMCCLRTTDAGGLDVRQACGNFKDRTEGTEPVSPRGWEGWKHRWQMGYPCHRVAA